MPSETSSYLPEDNARQLLQTLTENVNWLITSGATGKAATDSQKWQVGDTINMLSSLAGQRRARQELSWPAPPEYQKEFSLLQKKLLTTGEITRTVLVDYARVAAVIPPTDPLREVPLNFFFARALSVIDDPAERLRWAKEAIQNKYSVDRLRAALNVSRGKREVPFDEGRRNARQAYAERRGIYVCAYTGQKIVDLVAMVEVHLDRKHPSVPKALPARNRYEILRFIDLPALAAWVAGQLTDPGADKPVK